MVQDNDQLHRACMRAYERGRMKQAILNALPVLPMTAVAMIYTTPTLGGMLGVALAATMLGAVWRGGDWALGARAGLPAGAMALSIPVLLETCSHICIGPLCWSTCTLACAIIGAAAGQMLGRLWRPGASAELLLISSLTAALAGAMGCMEVGISGLTAALLAVTLSGAVSAQRAL